MRTLSVVASLVVSIAASTPVRADDAPPDRRPFLTFAPSIGSGAALASSRLVEQPQLRGFRVAFEGPGEKRSLVALEAEVWAGGWLGPRSPREVDGFELRFAGRVPVSSVVALSVGWAGGLLVAPAVRTVVRDDVIGDPVVESKRRVYMANAVLVRVHVVIAPFAEVLAEWNANVFTMITAASKRGDTVASPLRAGVEVRPFERLHARALATYSLFGGNALGWIAEIGVRL